MIPDGIAVTITIERLTIPEAFAIMNELPDGAEFTCRAYHMAPDVSPRRDVTVTGIGVRAAHHLIAELHDGIAITARTPVYACQTAGADPNAVCETSDPNEPCERCPLRATASAESGAGQ